jgi:hypothetical protein
MEVACSIKDQAKGECSRLIEYTDDILTSNFEKMSVLKGISYNPDILNTSNIFYRNAFDK